MLLFNTPIDQLPQMMTDKDLEKFTPFKKKTYQFWRATGKGPEYITVCRRVFYTKESIVNHFADALTQPL